MLLSIIVSTYNQEKYIAECLSSILLSLPEGEVEIIVANDYSTDSTSIVIDNFVKKYPKLVSRLISEKNVGANANYLRGHSAANGKYVAHIDGDDVAIMPKFSEQVTVMESDPSINLVFHRAIYFSDNCKISLQTGKLLNSNNIVFFSRKELAQWGPICVHSSFMYRRSSLNLNAIISPFMEWQIGMHCLQTGCGAFINKFLVKYRVDTSGLAMTGSSTGRKKTYEIQASNVRHFFQQHRELRSSLYAQSFVNALAQMKNGEVISLVTLFFLVQHLLYLSPKKIVETLRVRKTLRPQQIQESEKRV
jgi:glycosyltransferase involved in cell wall biosynthesis